MITPLGIQTNGRLIPYSDIVSVLPVERVAGWKIETYMAVITRDLRMCEVKGIKHVWRVVKEILLVS